MQKALGDPVKDKTIVKTWTLEPDQGSMFLASSAPVGYEVLKIDRRGNKATVTYRKVV